MNVFSDIGLICKWLQLKFEVFLKLFNQYFGSGTYIGIFKTFTFRNIFSRQPISFVQLLFIMQNRFSSIFTSVQRAFRILTLFEIYMKKVCNSSVMLPWMIT